MAEKQEDYTDKEEKKEMDYVWSRDHSVLDLGLIS